MTHQSPDALTAEWRTGRHVGRTVYAQTGPDATRSDVLIGTMDTAELAQAAVDAHNASLGAEATLAEARQAAGAEAGRAAALEAVYRQTRAERDARSAEIEKLGAQLAEARAELETKSVVHECCEEVVELKKDRAHLKDGLAEAVRERDEARAQLAEARELARRWQRDAHKHREIADSRPGLTQIERAEIRQAATEIEQCSRQLVAEIGPDPAEHGRAVPNSTTYCCICGQPAPAGADVCSDECRTTLGDRENACAELTAALGDDDFEALVGRVLAQTVYPEPHVNALITEARRARAKAAAAAADAERATADTTTARAWYSILGADLAELRDQLAAGNASDGHHTHNELYDYRMLYNAHAAMGWLADGHHVVKSWYHSDGEPCFGGDWFVVAAELPTGQVTNHYKAEHWGLFHVPEALPPAYDGHTPADAADRLRRALDAEDGEADA